MTERGDDDDQREDDWNKVLVHLLLAAWLLPNTRFFSFCRGQASQNVRTESRTEQIRNISASA
jgi:hypothetical protein